MTTTGIFLSFILNGIWMEYNLGKTYGGMKFKFSTGFVLIQSLLMIIISLVFKIVNKENWQFKKYFQRDLILAGGFQAFSLFSTIQMSIKLSFLMKVLVRSSKFVSILVGCIVFKSDGH